MPFLKPLTVSRSCVKRRVLLEDCHTSALLRDVVSHMAGRIRSATTYCTPCVMLERSTSLPILWAALVNV